MDFTDTKLALDRINLTDAQEALLSSLENKLIPEYRALDDDYERSLNTILNGLTTVTLDSANPKTGRSHVNGKALTPEQEARIVAVEIQLSSQYQALNQRYERALSSILTFEQFHQLKHNMLRLDFPQLEGITLTRSQTDALWQINKAFEAQVNRLINQTTGNLTPESAQALATLEATYDQKLQTILSKAQYQQWRQNLAAFEAGCDSA